MAVDMVPQSRTEEILTATINGDEYTGLPQSRLEYLLIELKKVIEAGGGGGGEGGLIQKIYLNNTLQPITNKSVYLTVITNTVNNLLNYYLKTETYSKEEVNSLIAALQTVRLKKVSELPTEDISTNTIYLVPQTDLLTNSVYDEYINLDGTSEGWELIGNTQIDLTDYVTFDDLEALLDDYVLATTLATALENKVDKVAGKGLSTNDYTDDDKAKLTNIEAGAQVNILEGIIVNGTPLVPVNKVVSMTVLNNTVNNLLNYYLKTETYTKDEVNEILGDLSSLTLEIVEELPTSDISTTKIYLIETTAGSNVYMQHAYIGGEWAQLGTTQIDLTNYYTKAQIDALLLTKQDALTFDTEPTLGSTNPVTSGGVASALQNVTDGDVYSTTEVKTNNVWIDGKPIYRKVIACGALPNNTTKTVAHNIIGFDTVVNAFGVTKNPNDTVFLPLVFALPSSNSPVVGFSIDATYINIITGADRSVYTQTYITIMYTKTTD